MDEPRNGDIVHIRIRDADIVLERNAILEWFLASDCADLVFIDDEMRRRP